MAFKDWISIYPTMHKKDPKKIHVIILMSKKLPLESWEQLEFNLGDITVIKIMGVWGQLVLFNIYNDCTHDHMIQELINFHRMNTRSISGSDNDISQHHIMWAGDFNRHHPVWDNPEDMRLFTKEVMTAAEKLIKVTADIGLESALTAGVQHT
jgi:hypothetical protein